MKKIFKMLFSMILVLTMVSTTLTVPVHAYDESTPRQFTKIKKIDYPWWWSAKIDSAKDWSTYMCTYNGKYAYCLEASKNSPQEGQYAAQVIENNEAVRKLLYYGFGGPAQQTDYLKNCLAAICPDDFGDKFGNADDGMYLLTHIWLSYFYCGDLMGLSIEDFDAKWPGYGSGIINLGKALTDLPEPDYARFEPGDNHADFVAEFDKESQQQKTNTVKFVGSANASINVTLQEHVTLHNVTTGTTQTGGVAIVSGGQSFYLTAPLKNAPDDYTSENIAGNNCETFTALAIKTGSGSIQTEGTWDFDPDSKELYYGVNWMELGDLRLSKVDNTSAFQKGSQFRLVSTSYDGYDETFEVTKDENGDYELLVENLPIGTYALTEIDCDDYFAPTVAQWEVTIEKNKTTKQIVVNTLRPTGTLTVQKTLEDASAGAINKADDDITKTSYKIIAKEDIKDTVSLKNLYSKGEAITVGSGKCIIDASNSESLEFSKGVQLIKGTDHGDGTFSVDQDGKLELSGIPLGKYQVVETSCPDGYVLDKVAKDIQFTQEDYSTKIYYQSVNQTNKITKTVFSKKSITGEDELEGALLQVLDENDNVIDEWISSKTVHEIDGLKAGQTYILKETTAPSGYVKAKSIEFTVKDDGTVQTVEMIDKQVIVSKEDAGGKEVEGALLQVLDENGNIIDEWTSIDKSHQILGLEEGKTYTLHEDLAPNGYNIVNDIEFTVTEEKVNQNIKMVDTIAEVSKVDENDNLLKGAKLEVVSTKTKNVIDRWTTGQHIIDITDEMKNALKTNGVVEGTLQKDEKEVSYKITDNKDDYTLMLKDEEETTYYHIDNEGNETTHMIQGLAAGQEYILREVETPKGYATAKEQTFIVDENQDITLTMVDEITKVEISKQDMTTQKELAGAELQVTDEEGNIIAQWTSGKEAHMIEGLEVGKTYTLTETIAPKNYKVAQSIDFTVKDTGEIQSVVMYDELENVVVTGDQTNVYGYLFSLLAVAIFILGRIYFYHKNMHISTSC